MRGEVFLMATIYTYNSINLAVDVGPSTFLRIIQEAGYKGDAYVPDLNKLRFMSKYVCMMSYPYFNHAL